MTDEKKLVEAPKKSLLEITVDAILGSDKKVMAGKVPVEELKQFTKFDEFRQAEFESTFERNLKIRDPAEKYNQISRTFQQIKQVAGYSVGKEKYGGRFDDLEREDQLNMYVQLGTKMIDELITPEGTTGYKRR